MSLGLKTVFNTNQINTLENWINNLFSNNLGAGIFLVTASGAYQKYDNSGTPITNALADATSGDMIVLYNVTVNEENIILKNGVNFYFLNSTVGSSFAGSNPIFKDSGLAATSQFYGYGTIVKYGSGECIKTTNASSNIGFFGKFNMGSSSGNCITSTGFLIIESFYRLAGDINILGGYSSIKVLNLFSSTNITQSAGTLYFSGEVCGNINQTGGTSYYNSNIINDILVSNGASNINYSSCGNVFISGGQVVMTGKGQSTTNSTLLIEISGGNASINNAYIYADSDIPNVIIHDGTVYLNNCRIYANSPDIQYNIVKENGILVIDSCKLIGDQTNYSIASSTPQNVVCYNSYANTAKDPNITIKAGTLTVDSSVI